MLLRRSENLDADHHFRLRDLLRYDIETVRAYCGNTIPAGAGKFLEE
jgi:hypothetical protein